jgi:hypothetical protein
MVRNLCTRTVSREPHKGTPDQIGQGDGRGWVKGYEFGPSRAVSPAELFC